MDTMAFYGTLHKYFYGHHTKYIMVITQNIFMVITQYFYGHHTIFYGYLTNIFYAILKTE